MPNNPNKKNTQEKQFDNPGSQKGQQGKQGSGMGDQGGSQKQSGMKSQSSQQGGDTSSKQAGSYSSETARGPFGEGTDDETLDRGRRADSTNDPNTKWSPGSGGSEF